jgi:hypothetical protein
MAAQMHALAAVQGEIRARDLSSGGKYVRELSDAFREYESALAAGELEERIRSADIVLIGDYHALPASQRFAQQLVEQHAPWRPLVLAVEAVLARDQAILDAWRRREIKEEELRRRLRFDREWGYEWPPFYALLSAARERAHGLYALDTMPRDDLRRIRSRDSHGAAKILEIHERHPGAAIFVLFGESHLAPEHLPRALERLLPGPKVLTVLQNLDALYWRAMAEGAPAVSLGPDALCVFNASPLEKYESYRLCLERWNSAPEDVPDFAPAIYNLIFSLARSLGFRLNSPRNGTQPKFLADSLPEVSASERAPDRESATRLEQDGCFYVAETNTFLIRDFQIGHAAREAARFLHSACRGRRPGCDRGKAIEHMLAHFGAKLLCPALEGRQAPGQVLGERLYEAYLDGRVSPAALRRVFLTPLETPRQAEDLLAKLQAQF